MSKEVHWILELDVQAGQSEAFGKLMAEMVAATKANEPNTLNYEWHTNSKGTSCHLYERYTDSAAVMVHMGTFGEKYAKRFMTVFKPVRLVVYGSPDSTVKEALAGLSPQYLEFAGGYKR